MSNGGNSYNIPQMDRVEAISVKGFLNFICVCAGGSERLFH